MIAGWLLTFAVALVAILTPIALVTLLRTIEAHGDRWDRLESYGRYFAEVWHPRAYRRTVRDTRAQWRRRAEARQGQR